MGLYIYFHIHSNAALSFLLLLLYYHCLFLVSVIMVKLLF